jgi:glutathione S-transferase
MLLYDSAVSGNCYTIADIALYAYTHVADQAGFDLSGRPATRAWLELVKHSRGTCRSRTELGPRKSARR